MCEMTLNYDFYVQPSTICLLDVSWREKQSPVLPATSSKFVEACNKYSNDNEHKVIARIVFQLECLSTPLNSEWSSVWHLDVLAFVLKKPILSVYPNKNQRTRPVFHKKVIPRVEVQPKRLMLYQ